MANPLSSDKYKITISDLFVLYLLRVVASIFNAIGIREDEICEYLYQTASRANFKKRVILFFADLVKQHFIVLYSEC